MKVNFNARVSLQARNLIKSPLLSALEGGMAQWVMLLARNWWMSVNREFETPSKAPVVSLSKKLHPHCLVLVGSRNGFK